MSSSLHSRHRIRSMRRSLALALAATALFGLMLAPGVSAQVIYPQPAFHALNPQPLPP
jgi:energy-converting hydrogenase Eha subunit F